MTTTSYDSLSQDLAMCREPRPRPLGWKTAIITFLTIVHSAGVSRKPPIFPVVKTLRSNGAYSANRSTTPSIKRGNVGMRPNGVVNTLPITTTCWLITTADLPASMEPIKTTSMPWLITETMSITTGVVQVLVTGANKKAQLQGIRTSIL